jgi:hypothetical protein
MTLDKDKFINSLNFISDETSSESRDEEDQAVDQ